MKLVSQLVDLMRARMGLHSEELTQESSKRDKATWWSVRRAENSQSLLKVLVAL